MPKCQTNWRHHPMKKWTPKRFGGEFPMKIAHKWAIRRHRVRRSRNAPSPKAVSQKAPSRKAEGTGLKAFLAKNCGRTLNAKLKRPSKGLAKCDPITLSLSFLKGSRPCSQVAKRAGKHRRALESISLIRSESITEHWSKASKPCRMINVVKHRKEFIRIHLKGSK